MNQTRTVLGEGGRLVLPATYRKAMGIAPGDDLILVLDDHELRIIPPRHAIRRAQALVRRYVPAGTSLSGALIAQRRAEAEDA